MSMVFGYMTKDTIWDFLSEAKAIGWDTCHKIYLSMDDQEVEKMIDLGYGDDMVFRKDSTTEEMYARLEDWWANSCPLRFIQAVSTVKGDPNAGFETVIEQGGYWL